MLKKGIFTLKNFIYSIPIRQFWLSFLSSSFYLQHPICNNCFESKETVEVSIKLIYIINPLEKNQQLYLTSLPGYGINLQIVKFNSHVSASVKSFDDIMYLNEITLYYSEVKLIFILEKSFNFTQAPCGCIKFALDC